MQVDGVKVVRVGHDGTLERMEIERRETRQQFPKCHDILRVPIGISKESLVEPCRDPLGTSRIRQLDNSTTRHSLKSSCRNVELSKCRAVGSTTCRVGMEFKPRRTTSCCVCRGTPALHEEVGRCVGETLLLTWTSLESPSSKAATCGLGPLTKYPGNISHRIVFDRILDHKPQEPRKWRKVPRVIFR